MPLVYQNPENVIICLDPEMHIFLALQIIGPTVPVGRSIIMAVCRLISAVCLCVAHSMKPTAHRMISWRVLGGL